MPIRSSTSAFYDAQADYAERTEQARVRMFAAFDPITSDEVILVGWLFGRLTPGEADLFSTMVERRTTP